MTTRPQRPSLLRTARRYLGRYHDIGDHFVKAEHESFGMLESQGQSTYHCVDCGEEHTRTSGFSPTCGDGADDTGGEVIICKGLVAGHVWQYVCFTLLHDGEETRVQVPRYHEEYSEELQDQLAEVEEGEYYDVTLIAENAEQTKWYCGGLDARSQ